MQMCRKQPSSQACKVWQAKASKSNETLIEPKTATSSQLPFSLALWFARFSGPDSLVLFDQIAAYKKGDNI
jgi:hypothetical protein